MSGESFRERLSMLSRAELLGLVLLIAVLFGGAGLWYMRSLPRPVEVRSAPGSAPSTAETPSASPSPETILVDVAGWVRRPGVYEFHTGDRIVDAVEAAGGARPGAALETLNLAAPLADGTQVLVLKAASGVGVVPGVVPAAGSGTGSLGSLVNINTATATELEALPGVGEVIAQRIVDHRTANGPFTSVDQLLDVSGIGESTLESMRESVTV